MSIGLDRIDGNLTSYRLRIAYTWSGSVYLDLLISVKPCDLKAHDVCLLDLARWHAAARCALGRIDANFDDSECVEVVIRQPIAMKILPGDGCLSEDEAKEESEERIRNHWRQSASNDGNTDLLDVTCTGAEED